MPISFMTTLSRLDWVDGIGGWRCEALRVPGARVDAIYADNTRLDPAWYQVDTTHSMVRWGREAGPPDRLTVGIVLEKDLSTEDLTARWKKLAIFVPLFTAVIGAVGGRIVMESPQATFSPARYRVEGTVELGEGSNRLRHQDIQLCIRPPDLILLPDGSFKGEIPLLLDKSKKLVNAPKILIDSGRPQYLPAVVHILNKDEKAPIGVADYDIDINHDDKLIRFRKEVRFLRAPEKGYDTTPHQKPLPVPAGQTSDVTKS